MAADEVAPLELACSLASELRSTMLLDTNDWAEEANTADDANVSGAAAKLDVAKSLEFQALEAGIGLWTDEDTLLKNTPAADEALSPFEPAPPPQAVNSNTATAGAIRDNKNIEKPFITLSTIPIPNY